MQNQVHVINIEYKWKYLNHFPFPFPDILVNDIIGLNDENAFLCSTIHFDVSHQYCIHSESRWTNFWNKSNSFIFLYFCTSRNSWTFHINYRGSDKNTDTGTRACEKKIAKMKWRSKYFTVYKFLYCRGVICECENII